MSGEKLIAALCVWLMLIPALAQQEKQVKKEQAQKFLVRMEVVRPDMLAEYEDLVKNELIAALKKGGITSQQAWATAGLGSFHRYIYVNPIKGLGIFDEPSPAEKALGREGAQRLMNKLRRCVAAVTYMASVQRPDLSYMREGASAEPAIALVAEYKITPGRRIEFERLLKEEVLPAMKKGEVAGYTAYQILLGGDPNAYIFVAPIKDFAELDKGAYLERALGREAYQALAAKMAGVVASVEVGVYRHLRELSYK